MKSFLNYIGSRRFAIYLLALTVAVILSSNLLPNVAIMDAGEVERLKREKPFIYSLSAAWGMERLAKSPYFQVIPAFIFLSISVCTINRFRSELEKERKTEIRPEGLPVLERVGFQAGSLNREEVVSMIERSGWLPLNYERGDVIYAKKGEKGIWGSLAFHLGMNITLIGILISVVSGITGKMLLTEGFPVEPRKDIIGVKEKEISDFPLGEVMLESFVPVYADREFPVEYTCNLKGVDRYGRAGKYVIKMNQPLWIDGYKLIFGKASFAPRFVLRKEDGDVMLDAVVNLQISMPGTVDYFDVREEGLRIKAELFPDYYEKNGEYGTRGRYPYNPAIYVKIEKWGEVIGSGFLLKGKRGNFDKYSIEFTELNYWVNIFVSKDAGVSVIMIGFFIIVLGLSVRFVLNDKRLWIILKTSDAEEILEIGGRARFFPALFEEELKKMSEEFRSKFGKGIG